MYYINCIIYVKGPAQHLTLNKYLISVCFLLVSYMIG